MSIESDQTETNAPGEVRVRSNVCLSADDWHLVTADVIEKYGLPPEGVRAIVRGKGTNISRCSICRRVPEQFNREGCDYCAERGHGVISIAEAKRR